jgi:hypothetical protein
LHGEWQWQFDSGVIRKRRSRRVEWYQLESVGGSIDRVTTSFKKGKKKKTIKSKKKNDKK